MKLGLSDVLKFRRRQEEPFRQHGLTVRCHRDPNFDMPMPPKYLAHEAEVLMSAASQCPFHLHPPSEFFYFRINFRVESVLLGTVYLLQNEVPSPEYPDLVWVASKGGVAREICRLDEGFWAATENSEEFLLRFLGLKFWTNPDFASTDAVTGVKSLLNELMEYRVMLGNRCPPNPWAPDALDGVRTEASHLSSLSLAASSNVVSC